MDQKEIIVEIDATGDVKIATKGYRGKACKDATKALEAALGEVSHDAETAEMKLTEIKQNECNRAKH